MGRKKSEKSKTGNFSEINRLIARFLEDVTRDFKSISDESFTNRTIIYGFNVRMDKNGNPIVEQFGNVKPSNEEQVLISDKREPLVDIIEKDKEIIIIAEMPGISKGEISITATPMEVHVWSNNPDRGYSRRLKVPNKVNPDSIVAKFRNGVLEMTCQKVKQEKPIKAFNKEYIVKIVS
ncbi:MAG: Hsp20 family protein [Candidatus Marsarchaeota archaeon]|nr:Hsp20 family protein [Candidatus Marsarchaeota archaeon]